MNTYETQQYLFDMSLEHIRKQGQPSVAVSEDNIVEGCRYVAGNLGCAAAPFIHNSGKEKLKDGSPKAFDMNQWRWSALCNELEPGDIDDHANENRTFVGELQACHDDPMLWNDGDTAVDPKDHKSFMEAYERRMERMAERYHLEYQEAA